MPAFVNLPWMNSSDQFLRAITAGADLASARESRALQAALADRPRFGGGGGHFRPPAPVMNVPAEVNPNDPHLNLQGSILSLVDPSQQAALSPTLPPQPFEAGGARFITNPSTGRPELYTAPSRLEKVGNDLVQITEDKVAGQPPKFGVNKLYEGGNPTVDRINLSQPDTSGMSPDQVAFTSMFNPPRLSGSPSAISNYLAQAKGPQLPTAQEVIKTLKDGRKAVFDVNTKEFLRYAE